MRSCSLKMAYCGIKLMNLFFFLSIKNSGSVLAKIKRKKLKGKKTRTELMACGFSHVDFLLFNVFLFGFFPLVVVVVVVFVLFFLSLAVFVFQSLSLFPRSIMDHCSLSLL